jgi:hypothetical protein
MMKNKIKNSFITIIFSGIFIIFGNIKTYSQIVITVCADDNAFSLSLDRNSLLPYMLENQLLSLDVQPSIYEIIFAPLTAVPTGFVGFSNITGTIRNTIGGAMLYDIPIRIPVPNSIYPNHYTAILRLTNSFNKCTFDIPLQIDVLYKSNIIDQRWNDVFAVFNANFNGGYTFSSYQWYRNGVAISGATHSILYAGDLTNPNDYVCTQCVLSGHISTCKSFREGDVFSVKLTRDTDGVTILNCPSTVMWTVGEVIVPCSF